jgi:cell division protein FtsQ
MTTAPAVRRRRRWIGGVLVLVTVAALAGGAIWLVYFSDVLTVRTVSVVGNRALSARQVVHAAQVPMEVPLARQNLDAIAQSTTSLPAVERASVSRSWPRTLTVTVVERRPVLAVRQVGGYLLVDRLGVAYEQRRSVPRRVVHAHVNVADRALLRDVGLVATALPETLRSKVRTLSAGDRDRITLVLKSGVRVNWGSSADSPLKAQIVEALLKRKPAATIDVSSPHTPAAR